MRKNNLYMVVVLFVFSVVLTSYSGSYYWDDGEIVRGGAKFNAALDEKLDQSGGSFFQLQPTAAFATATAKIGTTYMNASGAINFLSTGTTWLKIVATATGFEW